MKNHLLLTTTLLLFMLCLLLTACNIKPSEPNNTDEPETEDTTSRVDESWPADRPYELIFVSNGDGTCYVEDIRVNPNYTQEFILEIPEKSPAGDRVTEVRKKYFDSLIPTMMTVETYKKIEQILEARVEAGESGGGYLRMLKQFFSLQSLNNVPDVMKTEILKTYPILALTDVYTCSTSTSSQADAQIVSLLTEGAGYTGTEILAIYDELYQMVEESDAQNKKEIFSRLPKKPSSVGTYITEIVVPTDIEKIDIALYRTCTLLKRVELPSCFTKIERQAFENCSFLEEIILPNSVKEIGISAFSGCEALTQVVLGNSITDICAEAFSGCALTAIVLPDSLINIGASAFQNCDGLKTVNLSSQVAYIGESAFAGCYDLSEIIIPNGVIQIEHFVFENCRQLTKVVIPNGVTSIGAGAFRDCTGLTSITIPNSVTSIGSHAFRDCNGLTSIEIPNSVKSIEYYTFSDCTALASITIPKSVTSIRDSAFFDCANLTTIYYEGTEIEWSKIIVEPQNKPLVSADICYYSETQPTTVGNYWHYVDGVPTKW